MKQEKNIHQGFHPRDQFRLSVLIKFSFYFLLTKLSMLLIKLKNQDLNVDILPLLSRDLNAINNCVSILTDLHNTST